MTGSATPSDGRPRRPGSGLRAGLAALVLLPALAAGQAAPGPTPADTLRAAIQRSRAEGDSAVMAEAHNAYGLNHWNAARYDSAVAQLHEARAIWTALDDSVGLGRVNNNLGAAHYQWGNLEAALEAFLRSLEVRRALDDHRGVSLVLSNMGLTFRDWGQLVRARLAMEEAVAAAEQSGDPWVRGYARNNLGLVLLTAGDMEGARAAFQESLRISETPDPRLTQAQVRSAWGLNMHGLARVDLAEGDAATAVVVLEELFGGTPEAARSGRQSQALVDLGAAYQATGATSRAVSILELALELSREAGQRTLTLQALEGLSRVHEARREPAVALAYLRTHSALRDSLFAQSGAQQIAAMEVRAESERRALENQALREDQRVAEALIARQRLGFLLGGGLLAVSLMLAATLVHFNRQEKARQRLLAATNQALEETNQELRDALSEVRTLKGLIPICARCKKVRDDQGFWESVESYISSRSDALFSHGICNECGPELYGDAWTHPEPEAVAPHGAAPRHGQDGEGPGGETPQGGGGA